MPDPCSISEYSEIEQGPGINGQNRRFWPGFAPQLRLRGNFARAVRQTGVKGAVARTQKVLVFSAAENWPESPSVLPSQHRAGQNCVPGHTYESGQQFCEF